MNKVDQLFVRACKSARPHTRVVSVYRRFYFHNEDRSEDWHHLAEIISGIVADHLTVTPGRIINDMNPSNNWKIGIGEGEVVSHWERSVRVLIGYIRYANVDEFEGLASPRWARD